ncbi:MAG: hypothetical protein IT289_12975 [Oligoflexia bacterium]|nr:hypothetical protein [Oligoflexia bacterium]
MASPSIPSLEALTTLSVKLSQLTIKHSLGGTGLLYALGLLKDVHDWDIQVDAAFEDLKDLLTDYKWTRLDQTERFASKFLVQLNVDGTIIDLIGEFAIRDLKGAIHKIQNIVSGYWKGVPLGSPEQWHKAYQLMNRPDRVQILDKFLK